jgi:amino-acid N-acetyltransferase
VLRRLTVPVRTARAGEERAIVALVEEAGLPAGGLAGLVADDQVLVAEDHGRIVGCVALEPAGHQHLLRLLAVTAGRRGEGLGRQLLHAALTRVAGGDVWTLTETAEGLLVRAGFVPVDRDRVDGPVTGTALWSQLCPATATALHLAPAATGP